MPMYDPKNASPEAIIERLWKTGHYDNPDHPTGIKYADLVKQTLYSPETRIALASFTEMMAAVAEAESFKIHGRRYHFDGEFGPATEATILAERCEHPDYHVPELALYDGYETLGAYEEATTAAAQGQSGNWKGCHGIGNFHACHVKFLNAPPAHLTRNDNLRFCLEAVTAANQAIGLQMYWSGPGCPIQDGIGHSQLTAQYVPSSNGWLGLAQVVSNRPCNSTYWSRYLATYLRTGTDAQIRRMWPILFLHEFGHNMGTGHTRGGIMNPGLLSLNPTWSGDVLSAWLRLHYGGEAIPTKPEPPLPPDPPTPPEPPVPPTPGRVYFQGDVTAYVDGKPIGDFILVPKPRL